VLKVIQRVFNFFKRSIPGAIAFDAASFSIRGNSKEEGPILWKDVLEIVAFKHDQTTTDLICLKFTDRDGRSLVVHEDMEGFLEFEAEMNRIFNLIEWRSKVVLPPFAENRTVIYRAS
jgi:hypothetical protein